VVGSGRQGPCGRGDPVPVAVDFASKEPASDGDATGSDAYYKLYNSSGGVIIGDSLVSLIFK